MSTSTRHHDRPRDIESARDGGRGEPAERRAHGKRNRGHHGRLSDTGARHARASERLEALVLDLTSHLSGPRGFEEVSEEILPMLPRIYPAQTYGLEPVRVMLPPGIQVEFAIDMGGSYGTVMTSTLDEWGVDAGTVAVAALDNLRRDAEARDPRAVEELMRGGLTLRALRAVNGWESALILVPEMLERFFGSEPILVAAPLRTTLLALDGSVDPREMFELSKAFATSDPRGLAVDPMLLADGRLHSFRRLGDGGFELAAAAGDELRPGRSRRLQA